MELAKFGMNGITDRARSTGSRVGAAGRLTGVPRIATVIRLAAVAVTVVTVTALAACGSSHTSSSGQAATHAPTGTSSTRPAVSLVITLTARPGAKPVTWTLQCDPTGGTHPDAAAACSALAKAKSPFAPTPKGMMCPMIVSKPATAKVVGTWHDINVNAVFSQGNGCQTSRWDKIGPVFGATAGASSGSRAPQE
jgi:Subtilisin inhibitor-like